MQMKCIVAAAVALAGFAVPTLESGAVFAADLDKPAVRKRVARHHHRGYAPRYAIPVDPYHYQYEPRGYYPYYRSDYWRPAAYVRQRSRLHYNVWNTQPPDYRYYRSWGYPVRYWDHKRWHAEYHGRHRPWHW
jgi:hypothetical protein